MIETHGGALANLVSGCGPEADLATRLLAEHGLTLGWDWYPLHQVLAILNRVGRELGEEALFRIGASLTAAVPPSIDDISKALQTIDISYHMSHRKNGALMFENGAFISDGIGCYVCTDETAGNYIVDSASLYPCAFDRGLVTAIAQRFEPTAVIEHLDGARCRRLGSLTCAYVITW
jgi:hypothetical protein